MTKIRSGLGWKRQEIRSLGTWQFAEKVAKTSGIMAQAVVLGVAMLALRDAIKPSAMMVVDSNEAELDVVVSIRAAQHPYLLSTHQRPCIWLTTAVGYSKQGQRMSSVAFVVRSTVVRWAERTDGQKGYRRVLTLLSRGNNHLPLLESAGIVPRID